MAIIVLAFVPVFALTGQEGKLFHPLAFTKTFAVLAATLMAVTLVPVLCTLLLGGKVHAEDDNPVMRVLRAAVPSRLLESALRHRVVTLGLAPCCLSRRRAGLARGIGSEFMPPLNEGDLMFMPIADPSISLEENTRIAMRRMPRSRGSPEVRMGWWRKVARADTSTDPVAGEHDRDDRASEAARPVAPGHDARMAARRDEPRRSCRASPTSGRCRSSIASTC